MPTEAEIEAAARVLCRLHAARFLYPPEDMGAFVEESWPTCATKARAALTAAEEVRGQLSKNDEAIIQEYEEYASGWTKTLTGRGEPIPHDVQSIGRLCALARRGAGQAVPDEAAIRADERERCAKGHDEQASCFRAAYETAQDSGRDYAWSRYLWHAEAAAAIRAAAPKPEDKP